MIPHARWDNFYTNYTENFRKLFNIFGPDLYNVA